MLHWGFWTKNGQDVFFWVLLQIKALHFPDFLYEIIEA